MQYTREEQGRETQKENKLTTPLTKNLPEERYTKERRKYRDKERKKTKED